MGDEKLGSDIRLDRFGKDLLLDRHGGVVLTSEGELEVVSGGALAAQDVRTELMLSPGSCFWAKDYGRGLGDSLKRPKSSDVEGLLRAAAFNDERIFFDSISTRKLDDESYLLSFALPNSVEPLNLYFDLKEHFDDVDQ